MHRAIWGGPAGQQARAWGMLALCAASCLLLGTGAAGCGDPEDEGAGAGVGHRATLLSCGPETLYLNFDGATVHGSRECPGGDDATTNCSGALGIDVGKVTVRIPPFSGTDLQKSQIVELVRRWYSGFPVDIVTARPAAGHYSMVLVGGRYQDGLQAKAAGGVAILDCGNRMDSNIAFAFAETAGNDVNKVAADICQESAHAYGLNHVDDPMDVMHQGLTGAADGFHDATMQVPDEVKCDDSSMQNDAHVLRANLGTACAADSHANDQASSTEPASACQAMPAGAGRAGQGGTGGGGHGNRPFGALICFSATVVGIGARRGRKSRLAAAR